MMIMIVIMIRAGTHTIVIMIRAGHTHDDRSLARSELDCAALRGSRSSDNVYVYICHFIARTYIAVKTDASRHENISVMVISTRYCIHHKKEQNRTEQNRTQTKTNAGDGSEKQQ